jgi:hypothetical protein
MYCKLVEEGDIVESLFGTWEKRKTFRANTGRQTSPPRETLFIVGVIIINYFEDFYFEDFSFATCRPTSTLRRNVNYNVANLSKASGTGSRGHDKKLRFYTFNYNDKNYRY